MYTNQSEDADDGELLADDGVEVLGSKYLSTSSNAWLPYIVAIIDGVSCATGPSSSTYGNAAMLRKTERLLPLTA